LSAPTDMKQALDLLRTS